MSGQIVIIAIDPGAKGAIAILDPDRRPYVVRMPETPREILEYLREQKRNWALHPCECVIEQVGQYFPLKHIHDPAKRAVAEAGRVGSLLKLREHYGELQGFLGALDIPFSPVTPTTWMNAVVSKESRPKGGSQDATAARKKAITARMQELYPELKITNDNADALGILTWRRRLYNR